MKFLNRITLALAKASGGNPVLAVATVILFFVMFNTLEAGIETLLFGERFQHWLDVVFQVIFIAYAAYSVWWCALLNESREK